MTVYVITNGEENALKLAGEGDGSSTPKGERKWDSPGLYLYEVTIKRVPKPWRKKNAQSKQP